MSNASGILIHGGALLTPSGWIERGYIYLFNGFIEQLGLGDPPEELLGEASKTIVAENRAVLPGLTNGHTHFSQTFMRGLAGGRPLLRWLKERIWPLQNEFTKEDMVLAARLGILENIRCGATRVTDHHKITRTLEHTEVVCRAADEMGIRLTLARSWSDMGAIAESPETILEHLTILYSTWKGGRISIANGPLAAWRCSERTLVESHALAVDHNSCSHIHIAEAGDEVEMSRRKYDMPPVEWLSSLGILDSRMELVHSVWVDDREIDAIADSGATVVHCPVSNAVLGSGIAPIPTFLEKGIRVILGTDGPASNDNQDIFETIKSSIQLARVTKLDPTVMSPEQALHLALDGRTLQEGEPADLIVVNLDHPRVAPVHDHTSALSLCCHGSDVETMIVDGKLLMLRGEVLVLEEERLLSECRQRIKSLRTRAGLDR